MWCITAWPNRDEGAVMPHSTKLIRELLLYQRRCLEALWQDVRQIETQLAAMDNALPLLEQHLQHEESHQRAELQVILDGFRLLYRLKPGTDMLLAMKALETEMQRFIGDVTEREG
jgi:hypothetical protein